MKHITKPTLLVDEQKVRKNIQKMVTKAAGNSAMLRPHFKTHQSADIAEWFRDAGIDRATVSSVDMARYFADAGWKDLTIAFPYNQLEYEEINKLAQKISLNVTIVSKEALVHLNKYVDAPLGYFIKVDVGTHRTGIDPSDPDLIRTLAKSKNGDHQLKGLLAHAGHSYRPITQKEAQEVFNVAMEKLNAVKAIIGDDDLLISYGDTPTCSLLEFLPGVGELRSGNFTFYDAIQHHFGSCELDNIAVCMACPVVAQHPERGETIVYGGGVHFSKDYFEENGKKVFGRVVRLKESGWETIPIGYVARLSQEHGIVVLDDPSATPLHLGDLVGILPIHSCLTADLQGYYVSLAGKRINKINKAAL